MAFRQIQQENVFIYGGTLATFCAFREGHQRHSMKLRYEIRSGRKGKGKVLARAICFYGYHSQSEAIKKLEKKVGGMIEFMDENNIDKFEAVDYIPDPFERG